MEDNRLAFLKSCFGVFTRVEAGELNHENPESGYSVLLLKFDAGAFRSSYGCPVIHITWWGILKVNVTLVLKQATKGQRGSRGIALLFL